MARVGSSSGTYRLHTVPSSDEEDQDQHHCDYRNGRTSLRLLSRIGHLPQNVELCSVILQRRVSLAAPVRSFMMNPLSPGDPLVATRAQPLFRTRC